MGRMWIVVLCLAIAFVAPIRAICSGEWLAPSCDADDRDNCAYIAQWSYRGSDDTVVFNITTRQPANRWLGIGLARTRAMENADVYLAWSDGISMRSMDGWIGSRYSSPVEDQQNDLFNVSLVNSGNRQVFSFRRRRVSMDQQDHSFTARNGSCPYFLFPVGGGRLSFGDQSNPILKHESRPFISAAPICIGPCGGWDFVRLVGGNSSNEGRVQVYHNEEWGTVCDDGFDNNDASVFCRTAGLGEYGEKLNNLSIPFETRRIWLEGVDCTGTERHISQCPHAGWGIHDCTNYEDVVIRCSNISTQTTVRLAGGSNDTRGRVEVLYNGVWGTVCDDSFDDVDAAVFCHQAGFDRRGQVIAQQLPGQGQIWLDDVECNGAEDSITQCRHLGWGSHNCVHQEDVVIQCFPADPTTATESPSTAVPVPGIISMSSTFVVKKSDPVTVTCLLADTVLSPCDDVTFTWYYPDNSAIHSYHPGFAAGKYYKYDSRVFFSVLNVTSTNYWLTGKYACRASFAGRTVTAYAIIAIYPKGAVSNTTTAPPVSSTTTAPPPVVPVRLIDGPSPFEGRLEVYYRGSWGTVCDDYFGDTEASVVCRMLGRSFGEVIHGVGAANNVTIWLDDVRCDGGEIDISRCDNRGWGTHNCQHNEDVYIRCGFNLPNSSTPSTLTTSPTTPDIHVRLNGGLNSNEGRLEVYFYSQWGTVCNDGFGRTAASVVCRQLGWAFGVVINKTSNLDNTLVIWLDDVVCSGSEIDIKRCSYSPLGVHNCLHTEDVFLRCSNDFPSTTPHSTVETTVPYIGVRLVGGENPFEGRLEVLYQGQWGSVCDDLFDDVDASVFCLMGSLGIYGRMLSDVPDGAGQIWLDDVQCPPDAMHITACTHSGWGNHDCGHYEDVGIQCFNETVSTTTASTTTVTTTTMSNEIVALLVGGEDAFRGRLEIFRNGIWGTVCDDEFEEPEAGMFCVMMELGNRGRVIPGRNIPVGSGQIWLDDVDCPEGSGNLTDCTHRGWGVHNCFHSEDVRIECYNETVMSTTPSNDPGMSSGPPITTRPPPATIVRLTGGENSLEGQLEVYHNDIWNTVCTDLFTNLEASVVCRMIGRPFGEVLPGNSASGEDGLGRLAYIYCQASDTNIAQCFFGVNSNCLSELNVNLRCGFSLPETPTPSTPPTSSPTTTTTQPAFSIQLEGGDDGFDGLLLVYYDGEWGTVCADGFTTREANVVCRMIGRPFGKAVRDHYDSSAEYPVVLEDVSCLGFESSITRCNYGEWGNTHCDPANVVGVRCVWESN